MGIIVVKEENRETKNELNNFKQNQRNIEIKNEKKQELLNDCNEFVCKFDKENRYFNRNIEKNLKISRWKKYDEFIDKIARINEKGEAWEPSNSFTDYEKNSEALLNFTKFLCEKIKIKYRHWSLFDIDCFLKCYLNDIDSRLYVVEIVEDYLNTYAKTVNNHFGREDIAHDQAHFCCYLIRKIIMDSDNSSRLLIEEFIGNEDVRKVFYDYIS